MSGPSIPPPRRILLVRPSSLGDVCRSVHILASLRAAFPAAWIDWLVQDSFVDAVRFHPALSGVVPFPRARLAGLGSISPSGLRWLRSLRRPRYDLVIDAQGLLRSGIFTLITGARVRVGFANAREFGWLGANRRAEAPEALHAVERMALLLTPIGVPAQMDLRLYPPGGADAAQGASRRAALLAHLGIDSNHRFLLLAPTSKWAGKCWPPDRFAALAETLLARDNSLRVVVTASASERAQCAPLLALADRCPHVIDAVGKTSVADLLTLIDAAALVVANDSAALHMAAGLGRPLVALFGPTDTTRVGPWQRAGDVIQHITPADTLDHKDAAAGAHLMQRIQVDEVVDACAQRLA
ncbi:putative lipopolysaccharide heptosyltransferase III [soil metagenome]